MGQKPFTTTPKEVPPPYEYKPFPGEVKTHYVDTPPEKMIAQRGPVARTATPDIPRPSKLDEARNSPYGYAVIGEETPEDRDEDAAGTVRPRTAPNAFAGKPASYSPMKLKK